MAEAIIEIQSSPYFYEKRVFRRKDKPIGWKINYFLFIVDQAFSSLKSRFEQFVKYKETWGFLLL